MKQAVLIISLLLMFITGICAWWFWHDMQTQLNAPLKLDARIDFTIKPGTGLRTVTHELKNMGLMYQPYYLLIEARRQGKESRIKAGEYEISPGTTPLQLLDQFVAGKVKQHALTLIEGWSFAQLLNAVKNNQILQQSPDLIDGHRAMAILQNPEFSPEGQFFPDTYHFPRGTTDIQFLQRVYDKMQLVLAEEWEQRSGNLPYQSPYEALVMASLIEKETALPEERGDVAGVFVRRLQRGMKLQTDPTVIYAMGDQYGGKLLRKDLDIDSPYNTYVYAGLPPTPIALAGRESLRAALHPEEGNTLYFVARGDGSHQFSETLDEHNKAVARYILGKQNNEKQ
jgi:UPF0755 protein